MEDIKLDSKTVIVTGSNTGIGKETARELAKRGARVILACRDQTKAEAAREEIIATTGNSNVVVKLLNLASLQSIKQFAEDINQTEARIDILVNNAGVYAKSRRETEDGFEMMFGVNHLGHFYLTNLILDKIKASAPSRIVNLSSEGHRVGKLNLKDPQTTRGYTAVTAYGRSKTASILFGVQLTKILKGSGVTVYAVHPGVIRSEIFRDFDEKSCMACCCAFVICITCQKRYSLEQGAMTTLYCCLEPSLANDSGKYYADMTEKSAMGHARDEATAQKLWDLSMELCQISSCDNNAPTEYHPHPQNLQ